MTEQLKGIRDVAEAMSLSKQMVSSLWLRGSSRLPKPSYLGLKGEPLWRRATLERHGIRPR